MFLIYESYSEHLDPPQNKLYHQRCPDGRGLGVRHCTPSDWQCVHAVAQNNHTWLWLHLICLYQTCLDQMSGLQQLGFTSHTWIELSLCSDASVYCQHGRWMFILFPCLFKYTFWLLFPGADEHIAAFVVILILPLGHQKYVRCESLTFISIQQEKRIEGEGEGERSVHPCS